MAQVEIDPRIKSLLLNSRFRPSVVTWNRLEGRPRTIDFDRSLRAEVRDALWMLCRQWQFGEFQGEDAGSAVTSKVQVRTARLNRYAGSSLQAVGYSDELPLETKVEREGFPVDLMTRARLGRQWLKLLKPIGNFQALYIDTFGFLDPATDLDEAHLRSDRQAWQTLEALKGRAVDGARLLEAMYSQPNQHAIWLAQVVPNTANRTKILAATETFKRSIERTYSQPQSTDDPSWASSYLEYQFACAAPATPAGDQQTVLVADQYHQGHLDWYSFDLASQLQLNDKDGANIPAANLKDDEPITFIPTPVEFPGMPNVRWWEFEDRRIDFGSIQPSTTDLATLILAEFGLIYGNDWSIVPYRMPVGALAEVLGIVVTDVFGVRTLIRPAANSLAGEQGQWGMYHLTDRHGGSLDRRLFVPPVLAKIEESAPLEKIILARDEMANMVMAIEQTIPGLVGGGIDGYEAAVALERFFTGQHPPSDVVRIDTGAAIQYQLGTTISENWIPFIPVHNPGSNREIRLQRAAMPRLIPGTPTPVHPRGAVLSAGLDTVPPEAYFIHEEEVPRAGAIVTRTYQRARWWNGKTFLWLGRRKQTGRGQGSSGLEFDRVIPLESGT
ncbi:MAG: hypothetical protein KF716_14630 [Anaerolineae bacterium]|nr:hypothetical protein [Anaerolineae bacterium]